MSGHTSVGIILERNSGALRPAPFPVPHAALIPI